MLKIYPIKVFLIARMYAITINTPSKMYVILKSSLAPAIEFTRMAKSKTIE